MMPGNSWVIMSKKVSFRKIPLSPSIRKALVNWSGWVKKRAGKPVLNLRLESAVNMVVIPSRSIFSMKSGWITCPVHHSGCQSLGWQQLRLLFDMVMSRKLQPGKPERKRNNKFILLRKPPLTGGFLILSPAKV